ncbi:MAG TPA: UTP--glucose-1-phosphate uridylyltransferase, partial [Thermoanaerobaculia bacterium]
DRSLESLCAGATLDQLLEHCAELDRFRRSSENLYHRVRALFFLYAIHRFHMPLHTGERSRSLIPYAAYTNLLRRRFQESIDRLLAVQAAEGPGASLSSGLAAAYRALGFQTLADQVRRSVRSVRGNQWMFRTGHPADYPLRLRPELLPPSGAEPIFPILREATPVRMDLTHSGWSDIFFLGMDFPEGARVINISVDLAVRGAGQGAPRPPVEAYFRVIDEPVIRLTSVDLHATTDVTTIAEVFDFARDYLGLLKAAVIASGLVPSGMEGSTQPLADVLRRMTGRAGHGIEIASKVNDIPKGSRLAVSTTLLACLIAVCMRATRQIAALTGELTDDERRLVAARAILGEWLGGSGGGWQDSGGVWPGIKLIHGVAAAEDDPEYGVSRGCLLPRHRVFGRDEVSAETRERLQDSLVLAHGGMAQDVGPILEMVTEKYLLRSEAEWTGRREAIRLLDVVLDALRRGDIPAIGASTQRNFDGPIQTVIPWAGNLYTNLLIRRAGEAMGSDFLGFWMLGGMAGGGMGFLFAPGRKSEAQDRMAAIMRSTKRELERSVPFAMDPVVYDFAINERGSTATLLERAEALLPAEYYTLVVPGLLRAEARLLAPARRAELDRFSAASRSNPQFAGSVQRLFDHLLPRGDAEEENAGGALDTLLDRYGFDRAQHERIQADLRAGRIGLAQNRLPASSKIEDPPSSALFDARRPLESRYSQIGREALAEGAVAVVSLAGGIGSRWTKGAGVVKALNPFCRLGGQHRSFVEVHLAKSLRTGRRSGRLLPHVLTTSYLTHDAIESRLRDEGNYGYPGPLLLSAGRAIGLRMIP